MGGGPIVGVAERRGPAKEMNPELRGKLTLQGQAQGENHIQKEEPELAVSLPLLRVGALLFASLDQRALTP